MEEYLVYKSLRVSEGGADRLVPQGTVSVEGVGLHSLSE